MYFANAARAIVHRRPVSSETWLVVEELEDLLECIREQDARTEHLVDSIILEIQRAEEFAA